MRAMEYFLHFHRLAKLILGACESPEEGYPTLATAAARHYLSPEGRKYLNGRDVQTQREVIAALSSYKETSGGLIDEAH